MPCTKKITTRANGFAIRQITNKLSFPHPRSAQKLSVQIVDIKAFQGIPLQTTRRLSVKTDLLNSSDKNLVL